MNTNVLHIIGSFHQGGSERQAVQLVRLLREENNFNIFLAVLNNDGILRGEIEKPGFTSVPEFPLASFYDANMIRQLRKCARFILDNKIEIIHTHDFYTNVFGILSAKLAGVKVRIAAKRETDGMRSNSQKLVEKQIFRFSNSVIANAEAVRRYLVKRGIEEQKISVIYNGLDLERLKPKTTDRAEILREFALPENKKIVTIVANLRHEVKNYPLFLRSAKKVKENFPGVAFVCAGEGELLSEMRKLAEELNIGDAVYFLGRCAKIAELLSVSDICVLSSVSEGFSNSILEYMSAGKPIVATNVGGASEAIIDGETGFLVESNNDAQMAEKLLQLLQNDHLAEKYGRRGREIVETTFSCEAQLQKTKNLYQNLLEKL